MTRAVPSAEFARNFGRYKLIAQRRAVPVSSNGMLAGYFVAPDEYENLQKLEAMHERFQTLAFSERDDEAAGGETPSAV